ncbi:MAG: oligosaccharide repeat unit polymerase [Staphylococcus epidermidis]|nr:oligosaccharide repeat unit polymerase [Staphylococcus epidermidis]
MGMLTELKYSKIYIISYCILMFTAAFNSYSEFNSLNPVGKPIFISILWAIGVFLFLAFQTPLIIYNFKNKYKIYLFVLLIFSLLLLALKIKFITFSVFCLCLLIINSEYLDFKSFMKYDLIIRVVSLGSILLMFYFNLFPSAYTPLTLSHGNMIRSTLGFNHPNTLGGYYIYILISLILFIHSRTNISLLNVYQKVSLFLFVFLSGFYVEFILSGSRSGEITLLIIVPFLLLYMIRKWNVPQILIGYISLFVIFFVSILLPYFFSSNNQTMLKLNNILSNRLLLQSSALHEYSIGLKGNSHFVQGKPFYIDNQYLFNLLAVGLIGSIIMFVIIIYSMKYAKEANDFILFFILIAVLVKAMVESTEFDYYALVPFIYSFKYFWGNRNMSEADYSGGN